MADGTRITEEQIKKLWKSLLGEEPTASEFNLFARGIRYFGAMNPLMVLTAHLIHLTHRDAQRIEFEILDKGPEASKRTREMIDEFDQVLGLLNKIHVKVQRLIIAHDDISHSLREHEIREQKWRTERRERWRQILSGRHPMTIVASGMVGIIFASFFGTLLAVYALGSTPNLFGAELAPAARPATESQQMQSWQSAPSRGLTPSEKAAEDAEYR